MRRDVVSAAMFGASLAFASSPATAQPPPSAPLVFVVDPKLGMEAGIRTFDSLGRVVFRYDEALPTFVELNERRFWGRTAGVLARTAQVVFVDLPLADFQATAIHEVFGHGSRAREFGQDASFQFNLPSPYCSILEDNDSCGGSAAVSVSTGRVDRDLLVGPGGMEANSLTAHWINLRTMRSAGRVHVGDLLVYGSSKLAYVDSYLDDGIGVAREPDGNDVQTYIDRLQDRFDLYEPAGRRRIASRLQAAWLWNLADPMLMYSFYGVFYRAIGRGERTTTAPIPTVGKTRFYAAPRFSPSPFGAEHYLDLLLSRDRTVLALYGRVGSSGLASYTGGGARLLGLPVGDRVEVGAELDVWRQPETLLDERSVYDRADVWGANVAGSIDVRLLGAVGVTGRLGYKSVGYLVGQPAGEGVHGYVGMSLALDRAPPLPPAGP